MKKIPHRSLLFTTLLLLFINNAQATHNRAGEITYSRIAPYTKVVNNQTVSVYTYSIVVTRYFNHGAGIADRCVDTVYFGDGSRAVAPRQNGSICGDCGSAIACGVIVNTSAGSQMKVSIYSVTHTYPGPGNYLIRSFDRNRSPNIVNVPNSVNVPFYLEARLIASAVSGINSSPTLSVLPVSTATTNTCFLHNPGASDTDGDSLSYEITTCREENGNTIQGYAFPHTGPGGTYGINAVSGLLSWCSPVAAGKYALAFLVKEWRKNQSGTFEMIGYLLRDMEVEVIAGPVGLSGETAVPGLIVSPNPAAAYFEVRLEATNSGASCSLHSVEGRLVKLFTVPPGGGSVVVETAGLQPGVYLLKVVSPQGTTFKRLILE